MVLTRIYKICPQNFGRQKPKTNFRVEGILQTAFHEKIDDFIVDETQTTLIFPASLTHIERGYIHAYVGSKGLKSKSTGKGKSQLKSITIILY